jgi:3-hydroxyacyl-[acyl-carrier-protein] dehydratase
MADRRVEPVSLEISKILNILPHRYPFVMVDRVTEAVPGKYIRGHKCVSFNEPFFQGHFPQRPIMPGVLILEALAQIGGILAYVSEPFDAKNNIMFFLGIGMDLHVEVMHHRSNTWKFAGEVLVEGTLCTEGEFLASIVDRNP